MGKRFLELLTAIDASTVEAPKRLRRYADLSTIIEEAARAYTRDVKDGSFPSAAETYSDVKTSALRQVR